MRRWLLTGSAIISVALATGSASAGGWKDNWNSYWHGVHVDFHRNNAWPEPFNTADRARVREPFCIQADNGWKLHNTIGSYLYDPETPE